MTAVDGHFHDNSYKNVNFGFKLIWMDLNVYFGQVYMYYGRRVWCRLQNDDVMQGSAKKRNCAIRVYVSSQWARFERRWWF